WKVERRPIETTPEPHRNQPPLSPEQEAIARATTNGTLLAIADRIWVERGLKSRDVARTLAEIEVVSKINLTTLPHQDPCPTCGKAQHADGLCRSAQRYAKQDQVSQAATLFRRGGRAKGRVRTGHGTGQRWGDPAAYRRRERDAKKVAEATRQRKE